MTAIKLSKKAVSYGGSLVPDTLEKFRKESRLVGLPEKPARVEIEQLMAHFLMTSDLYDNTVLPSGTSKNFDKWINGKKWDNKTGSKYDLSTAKKTKAKKNTSKAKKKD